MDYFQPSFAAVEPPPSGLRRRSPTPVRSLAITLVYSRRYSGRSLRSRERIVAAEPVVSRLLRRCSLSCTSWFPQFRDASVTTDLRSFLQVGTAREQERFGPLRFSGPRPVDHDAALVRVSSPLSVRKALAPPPGTSVIGTLSFARVGSGSFSVSFEFSQSSYGCGPPRSWTSAVVVSSRSNGTWESRSIEQRSGSFPDVSLDQPPLLVLLVLLKIRIITSSCILVDS